MNLILLPKCKHLRVNKVHFVFGVMLILLSLSQTACTKKLSKTQVNSHQEATDLNSRLSFKENEVHAAKVNHGQSQWHIIYGKYQLESHEVDVDYNTSELKALQTYTSHTSPFFSEFDRTLADCKSFLKDDFANEGWTYDYIVYYLMDLSESHLEYETIVAAADFKAKSEKALAELQLKRVGIFDAAFNSTTEKNSVHTFVLDFWLPDMDTADRLAVKMNATKQIHEISIEG